MSSTRTLVALLRPWIRRFTIIISAWWLRTSSKVMWEEVQTSTVKLGKQSTPKRVRIRPKHSAPSFSRDRRIKMHQSIDQSINQSISYHKKFTQHGNISHLINRQCRLTVCIKFSDCKFQVSNHNNYEIWHSKTTAKLQKTFYKITAKN